jgi:hypothetical protein
MNEDHFSLRGGARIGMMNASIPFAQLSISRKGLRLSSLGREYFFARERISVLSRYQGFFSTGLRIDHTVPVYPEKIVFWVAAFLQESRFARLKEVLNEFDYEVNL